MDCRSGDSSRVVVVLGDEESLCFESDVSMAVGDELVGFTGGDGCVADDEETTGLGFGLELGEVPAMGCADCA